MKVAFVGGWGHRMLRPMLDEADPKIDAVAVAGDGVDDPRAEDYCRQLGRAEWFSDGRKMLEQFRPDVVNVAGVYGTNARWIVEALRAGIPVVSEKPIATSWEELAAIQAVLAEKGGHLFTEFTFRCLASLRSARQAIQAGRIGEIALITGQKSYRFGKTRPAWYADRSLYGGTILWVASHAIDAAWYCSGLKFREVTGLQGNLSKPAYGSMEDHTASLFRLENGATCVIHADFLRPEAAPTHGDDRLRFAGSTGIIEATPTSARLLSEAEGEVDITNEVAVPPFHTEVLRALRGESSHLSTEDSLYMAGVLLSARDAADHHNWVHIPN